MTPHPHKPFTSGGLQGVKKGDLVFLKFPWGIGPRDEEYTDETGKLRRFSYIRYQDVASVVQE